MKRVAASFLPLIALDYRSNTPLYRQLYEWFRGAILAGQLRPGQRVPSTRSLATELKVSRIPVLNAYEQLLAEGYFESFVGAGTCVARSIPEDTLIAAARKARRGSPERVEKRGPRRMSRRGTALTQLPVQTWLDNLGAFRVSLPALEHFPIGIWSKIVARYARRPLRAMMAYGGPMGYLPFREVIAEYLRTVRGVRCEPSQIIVTTGSQQALQLSAQVLLDPKGQVWMEEPGYPSARHAFMTAGAQVIPVRVDHNGMDVAEVIRRGRNARVVYVTPSHQYPMGMTMSATRRMLLLNWRRAPAFGSLKTITIASIGLEPVLLRRCKVWTPMRGSSTSERSARSCFRRCAWVTWPSLRIWCLLSLRPEMPPTSFLRLCTRQSRPNSYERDISLATYVECECFIWSAEPRW